jgi:hypothetical protein
LFSSHFTYPAESSLSIYDNNIFVTTWILAALLESENLGTIKLHDAVIENALSAVISLGKARNFGQEAHDIAPMYTFWEQIECENATEQCWYAEPQNVFAVIEDELSFSTWIKYGLSELGYSSVWDTVVGPFEHQIREAVSALHIPPDFDDSSCALGLGPLLYAAAQNGKHQKSWRMWNAANSDIAVLVAAIKVRDFLLCVLRC